MSQSTIHRSSTRKPAPEIPLKTDKQDMMAYNSTSDLDNQTPKCESKEDEDIKSNNDSFVCSSAPSAYSSIITLSLNQQRVEPSKDSLHRSPLLIDESRHYIHGKSNLDLAAIGSPRTNRYIPQSSTMEFRSKKIPISINVPVSCRRLIELYGRIEQHSDYLGPLKRGINDAIQELAVYRYESLWLPLAAEHKLYAGAPTDVQAIWLAHMLDPLVYRQDCQRVAGKLIEHRLVSRRKLRQLTTKARGLWQLRYPKEPFDFDPNRTGYGHVLESRRSDYGYGHSNHISGEVLAISQCHSHFSYQVSLPHYIQVNFLEQAEYRYKQFLHVRKVQYQIAHYIQPQPSDKKVNGHWTRTPDHGTIASPREHNLCIPDQYVPIDIELAWRAHLVHPKLYARDTSCIFGKLLPHPCVPYQDTMFTYLSSMQAGWPSLRTQFNNGCQPEGISLHTIGFEQLWKAHFPTNEFYCAGSYDRGVPPRHHLNKMEATEIYSMSTKCAQMSLNSVIARFDPELEKFTIRIHHQHSRQKVQQLDPVAAHEQPQTSPQQPVQTFGQQIRYSWEVPYVHQPESLVDNCICKLHSPKRTWTATDASRPIARFNMISGVHDQLAIDLIDKRGWLCPNNTLLGRGLIRLTAAIEQYTKTTPTDLEFKCPLETETCEDYECPSPSGNGSACGRSRKDVFTTHRKTGAEPSVTLLLNIAPPTRHAVRLKIKIGPTFVCRLPTPSADVKSAGYRIWGPVTQSPRPDSIEQFEPVQRDFDDGILGSPDMAPTVGFPLSGLDESRSLIVVNKVLNHLDKHVLTVRVLHNMARRLAVVQVWSGSRLLCIGQQIGAEQLPEYQAKMKSKQNKSSTLQRLRERTRLTHSLNMNGLWSQTREKNSTDYVSQEETRSVCSDSCPTNNVNDAVTDSKSVEHSSSWGLNWQQNERAILIKDANGDWCILIGRWSGFKRFPDPTWFSGYPAENETSETSIGGGAGGAPCSTRGHGGHLSLRIRWFSLPEPKIAFAQIPDNVNSVSVILQETVINIQTGEIHISKHCQEIAQNVCLAFCCGLMHVICQPRVLTHELGTKSIWDLGISDTRTNCSSQPKQSQSIGSIHDADDPEQPSVMTASTSFDSSNRTQLAEPILLNGHQVKDFGMGAQSGAGDKLQWSINPVVPKEWETEKKRILNDGQSDVIGGTLPRSSDGVPLQSQVEILGVISFSETPSNMGKNNLPNSPSRCNNSKSANAYHNLDSICSTIGSPQFMTRGPLRSLTFALCRAVGFPADSLIASVQMARHLNRTRHLNAFLSGTTIGSVSEYLKSSEPADLRPNTRNTGGLQTKENGSPFRINAPRPNSMPSPRRDPRLLADWHKQRNQFIGWKLCDFYDYFLLELPDICSGCVAGCRYCSGVGLL